MLRWFIFMLGAYVLATSLTFGETSEAMLLSDRASGVVLIGLAFLRPGTVQLGGLVLVGLWLGMAPLLFWAKSSATYLSDSLASLGCMILFLTARHSDAEPSIPPGWSYNPSSWPQRLPIGVLAFFGWMLSRYMGAYELGYIHAVWDPFFPGGTLEVITSKVSRSFPVPDAGLGALAYMLEMLSAFKGGKSRWRTMPWMVVVFGMLAIPLSLTSVILIMLQPIMVGAWCTWCLVTAVCMLVLMALSLDEVVAVVQYLRRSKEKPFLRLLLEGGEAPGAQDDKRTPPLDAPLWTVLRSAFWGVTLPWNLIASMACGVWLMFSETPLDVVCGALSIVVAALATAEVARKVRWVNVALGVVLAVSGVPVGVLVALLAVRRGPVRETTG